MVKDRSSRRPAKFQVCPVDIRFTRKLIVRQLALRRLLRTELYMEVDSTRANGVHVQGDADFGMSEFERGLRLVLRVSKEDLGKMLKKDKPTFVGSRVRTSKASAPNGSE